MNIETPGMVIDIKKVRHNIKKFQTYGDRLGMTLRPHIKTHKMIELAKLQIEMGACGILCAKLSEAEAMSAGGIDDIFVAYPIIGENKIKRLLSLNKRAKIIASVDSYEGARVLSEAAFAQRQRVEVRIEIDTGMRRTGVPAEKAALFAKSIKELPGLNVTGIYTYKSAILNGRATDDYQAAAEEENRLMQTAADSMKAVGLNILEIGGGSTTTAAHMSPGVITEIHAGTYVFADAKRVKSGSATLEECAACVCVTVVSVSPGRAIIDGGVKAFGGDMKGDTPPLFLRGYGIVLDHPDLVFSSMTEEHGVLDVEGSADTGLQIGQVLRIVPNHICSAINLYNDVYMLRENGVLEKKKVDCRGLSY
jgi:D-serine deaminase-like pyridoxal phosphate-dependent protein